jgi:serine/threonine protein kinase
MDELPGLCAGGGMSRETSEDSGECEDSSCGSGHAAARSLEDGTSLPGVAEEIDARIRDAASNVRPFVDSGLEWMRTLQGAPHNYGRVDLMRVVATGRFVAVKRMPNSWVRTGPDEFARETPADELELPWFDVGLSGYLYTQGFRHACEPLGIFRDHEFTYVSSAFCSGGDLFGLMFRDPSPGEAREDLIRPIMLQVLSALSWLHGRGIAHLDVSLENILLGGENETEVKLIDFGRSTLSRTCKESSGKRSYTAPEMLKGPYDPFDSDAFAAGVVLYSLASRSYPWNSTSPGSCPLFDFVCRHGLRSLAERMKVWKGNGKTLSQVFSEPLVRMAEGLLSIDPAARMTISGQRLSSDAARPSVWDAEWLRTPSV